LLLTSIMSQRGQASVHDCFCNCGCFHEFKKADLRISIKDYRRSWPDHQAGTTQKKFVPIRGIHASLLFR